MQAVQIALIATCVIHAVFGCSKVIIDQSLGLGDGTNYPDYYDTEAYDVSAPENPFKPEKTPVKGQSFTDPMFPAKEAKLNQLTDSQLFMSDTIGPFVKTSFDELRVKVKNVRSPEDLSCSFDEQECCWVNMRQSGDTATIPWQTVIDTPNFFKYANFLYSAEFPEQPFAIAANRTTNGSVYAMLASCPLFCREKSSKIKFERWTSGAVQIDVCELVIGETEFNFCETINIFGKGYSSVTLELPPQTQPFTIVIIASEFTDSPGGIAVIDNISYEGDVCYNAPPTTTSTTIPTTTPEDDDYYIPIYTVEREPLNDVLDDLLSTSTTTTTTTTTTPRSTTRATTRRTTTRRTTTPTTTTTTPEPTEPPFSDQDLCAALACDWTDVAVGLSSCAWQQVSEAADKASSSVATDVTNKVFGNRAAGVRPKAAGDYFLGIELSKKSRVAYRSAPFRVYSPTELLLDFYEAAEGVQFQICGNGRCEDISDVGVSVADVRWQQYSFTLLPSDTLQQLTFDAENTGPHLAAAALGNIQINGIQCS